MTLLSDDEISKYRFIYANDLIEEGDDEIESDLKLEEWIEINYPLLLEGQKRILFNEIKWWS